MARFGGGLETPEEHAHLGTIDVISGFSGALAANLALFKRMRTGQADVARTSLAANAQLIQTPFMYDHPTRVFDEPSGVHVTGSHALYKWYATKDSHVFVGGYSAGDADGLEACSKQLSPLLELDLASMSESDRVSAMEEYLRDQSVEQAVATLNNAGVSAVPLSSLQELREKYGSSLESFGFDRSDEAAQSTFHFSTCEDHPIGSLVSMFAPCSLLAESRRVSVPTPAPKYGEHTRQVLTETLGYSDAEADELVQRGVASDSWSKKYIATGDPWSKVREIHDEYMQRVRDPLREPSL